MDKKFYQCIMLALALLVGTMAYCWAQGDEYGGVCVHVIDGDTVDIADGEQRLHRVRITGMDAPELAQAYGRTAKAALAELILHKELVVHPAGEDKYGRELGTLRLAGLIGELDVAECMVGGGHAFAWGSLHYKAQEHARENSLGLWAEARWQERPWLFRRRMRQTD